MKAFYMHFTINLINNCRRNFRTFFHETAFLAKNARFSCPSAVDIYPLLIYALLNNAPKLCVCASHIFYYFLFLLHVYKNTSCLFSFLQDSQQSFSPTDLSCSHFFRCTEATNTANTVGKFLVLEPTYPCSPVNGRQRSPLCSPPRRLPDN